MFRRAASRLREEDLLAIGVEPEAGGRRRGGPLARLAGGGLAAAAVVGLLALYAPRPAPSPPEPTRIEDLLARPEPALSAPPPAWRTLEAPQAAFGLDAPGFVGLASRHVARASSAGALEDALVFGAFEAQGAHLRLHLLRPSGAEPQPRSFFVDLAVAAAEAGLAVTRSGTSEIVETKLGALEAAPLELENGPARACLAFRGGEPDLRLFGWICGAPMRAEDLACLVDGLVLLDDGGDALLRAAFDEAEALRGFACPGAPRTVASIAAAAAAEGLPPAPPRRPLP